MSKSNIIFEDKFTNITRRNDEAAWKTAAEKNSGKIL